MSVKETNTKELGPFSRSEDEEQGSVDNQVIVLLDDIGVGVKGVLVRTERGHYAVDYELVEEVEAGNQEELVHH